MFLHLKNKVTHFFVEINQSFVCFIVAGLIIPLFLLLYFSFIKRASMGGAGIICVGDYLDVLADDKLVNLSLLPLLIILVSIISEHQSTTNLLLKYKSRNSIMLSQQIKIIFSSAVFCLYLCGTAVIVGGLLTPILLNWEQYESRFYYYMGYTLHLNFYVVVLNLFFRFFVLLLFFSLLVMFLSLITKKFLAYFLMFLLLATNIVSNLNYAVNQVFFPQVEKTQYINTSSIIVYFVIVPIITVFLASLSFWANKRKDFFV